jgi:hypothetical protein
MAFLNYFLQFKAFADKNTSNSPNLTNMNWVRDVKGVTVNNQSSQVLTIPASGSVTVFTGATKKFAYVESDENLNVAINGAAALQIKPLVVGTSTEPASLLVTATLTSLVLTNPSSTDPVSVFIASAE